MADSHRTYDPWILGQCLDRSAKWWWACSLILKALAFGVGVTVIFSAVPAKPIPFIVAVLTAVSELAAYRMEFVRGTAQRLRRKLDMLDSFAWEITGREFSDLLARCSTSVKKCAGQQTRPEPYFASQERAGARRGLENVIESAWWSKHLSETMLWTCTAIVSLAVFGSIVMMIVSLLSITNQDILSAVARIVTSGLLLVVSMGLVRLAVGYHSFARTSEHVENQAETMLSKKRIGETDVVKLVHEYQLARAAAPIIPEWVWRWRRGELNALWTEFRQRSRSGDSD